MFATDLHLLLGLATALALLVVVADAVIRLIRARRPGRIAGLSLAAVLILAAMAAAGGLALLIGGHAPRQWWHLMYAGFAFAMIPLVDAITLRAGARPKALARLIGGLIALEVIVRLYQTG